MTDRNFLADEYFYPTNFISKTRFSPIRTREEYIDHNDKKNPIIYLDYIQVFI